MDQAAHRNLQAAPSQVGTVSSSIFENETCHAHSGSRKLDAEVSWCDTPFLAVELCDGVDAWGSADVS